MTWVSAGDSAEAVLPTPPQPETLFDLGDLQTLAAAPTSGLISVRADEDGTASFALHHCEVGQGITDVAVVAEEAAEISQKMGKPVKLSWSRTDHFRQGRVHPMCVSRVRATYLLGNVLTYEQRHVSTETSFSHGLGEMLTSTAAELPIAGNRTTW